MNKFEEIRTASRTKAKIMALAEDIANWSPDEYDKALERFMNLYDDRAIKNLLLISAINKVKLNPMLLSRCLGWLDEFQTLYYAYGLQDETAIDSLLDRISVWSFGLAEYCIAAVNIAVELSIKFDTKKYVVNSYIDLIKQSFDHFKYEKDLKAAKKKLANAKYDDETTKWYLKNDPQNDLENIKSVFPKSRSRSLLPLCQLAKTPMKKISTENLPHYVTLTGLLDAPKMAETIFKEVRKRFSKDDFEQIGMLLMVHFIMNRNMKAVNSILNMTNLPDACKYQVQVLEVMMGYSDVLDCLELSVRYSMDYLLFGQFAYWALMAHWPALFIVFFRAMAMNPVVPKEIKKDGLAAVEKCRTRLGLEPKKDPVFKYKRFSR